ncbi:copper resistance protein NlpE N-terminal domain-containing protein [Acinetobacter sp. ANC 5579]|uniref:copper resistance protein NlpE N-terminal domain-containing protein n=1 Tax=Acinetobacter TaxID=469 RepID=UPI0015D27532|nr:MULTISPECIES: copper resistance protein NlpE N-terminal domain-containing protein [Acinetobacter]MCL6236038.1 copper resistance protein NlpE N-terminal domain-containing protein [Acinetobacter amyesii]
MKKVVLIPLVATSAMLGCQDSTPTKAKEIEAITAEKQQAAWVGDFKGTTPCMGCLSRCEDCPGMAVALELHEDQTYTLTRESLSGHNEVEVLKGVIRFKDESKQQLELMNVQTRNLLYVDLDQQLLEIREDQTAKRYQMQSDFLLNKAV